MHVVARDPDAHLTLDTVVCLGLHVDEEANQYVSAVSTPSLWLNPVRALQHGSITVRCRLMMSLAARIWGDNVSAAWHGEQ